MKDDMSISTQDHQKQRLYPTRNDIPIEVRSQVLEVLSQSLATTVDLKSLVVQARWNDKGMNFYQSHELFDEIDAVLEEYIDLFAEWIAVLSGVAMGTACTAAKQSARPEYPFNILDVKDHVTALADRLATYTKSLRNKS
jgi:starvation-inducible DNA-binding protein